MTEPLIPTPAGIGAAPDTDPQETAEWQAALASVLQAAGPARVREIMDSLAATARDPSVGWQPVRGTPYVNTIPLSQQPPFPGDLAIEERLASLMRWNALAMVVRANQSASTTSSVPRTANRAATWSSTSRTRPRGSTPGPSWKGA